MRQQFTDLKSRDKWHRANYHAFVTEIICIADKLLVQTPHQGIVRWIISITHVLIALIILFVSKVFVLFVH